MTIPEYMKLNSDDYCQCENPIWHDYIVLRNRKMPTKHFRCQQENCNKIITPNYEYSLDAQQPVKEKMVKDPNLWDIYFLALWKDSVTRNEVALPYTAKECHKAITKALETK